MTEEDNPPNEYNRPTDVPPADVVDARMVQLALSSMATTLESIERTVMRLDRQHESALAKIEEVRGVANLAGGMAGVAREDIATVSATCERIEVLVGRLARSMQGIDERSRSVYDRVFPDRSVPPPDIDLADIVPIRRNVMTGE